MNTPIKINRAPVLTLWAGIVAERLGYAEDVAMTLGKAVAGLNAQSKGRSLGIFHPKEKPHEDKSKQREVSRVMVCGRAVPVVQTEQGVRAVAGDKTITPESVQGYLKRSFGDELESVRAAMRALAKSYSPKELGDAAYGLYEQFRPEIPSGTRGWGAKGKLDLKLIWSLVKHPMK